ncbi:STAS domain-containing protein [Fictibacillus terranigra]|uniref:Anti-sigma factor antagonist n=1 Tax=Fictibacillus terranigra TaxID=3058424 RepID=A0ABT8EBS5_9BACL|nr:STAS domain-containing protein [Fictibacillus sp. CENA-BCM004]MDN4075304.1 STAS domain-containing protein [Fictibacillus sp. CENA-BCM004]
MNLKIKHEQLNDSHYLVLNGEIDIYTAPKLKEVLIPLSEEKRKDIIIDLQQIDFMDNTGLGIFIKVLKSLKKNDSTLKLRGLTDHVHRLFDVSGLTEVMDIGKKPEFFPQKV